MCNVLSHAVYILFSLTVSSMCGLVLAFSTDILCSTFNINAEGLEDQTHKIGVACWVLMAISFSLAAVVEFVYLGVCESGAV